MSYTGISPQMECRHWWWWWKGGEQQLKIWLDEMWSRTSDELTGRTHGSTLEVIQTGSEWSGGEFASTPKWHVNSEFYCLFEGITRRICRLLFENTTFNFFTLRAPFLGTVELRTFQSFSHSLNDKLHLDNSFHSLQPHEILALNYCHQLLC